jgi:hypothetical protein
VERSPTESKKDFMAQKAIYHNAEGLPNVEVFVLGESKDAKGNLAGGYDLGNKDGELLIRCARPNENVDSAPRVGSFTILVEAPATEKPKKKVNE